MWWHGPRWLSLPAEDWPDRADTLQALHVQEQDPEPELLSRFSTLSRLIRIVAYCRRPLMNLRRQRAGELPSWSFLTSSEISGARSAVIRLVQGSAFHAEIVLLTTGQALPKRHPLRKLNPFVDKADGLLRVGGRLCSLHPSSRIKTSPDSPSPL